MRIHLLAIAFVLTVFAAVGPAATNVWYVDVYNGNDSTGNGTVATPWKTIQKAVISTAAADTTTIHVRAQDSNAAARTAQVLMIDPNQNGATIRVRAWDPNLPACFKGALRAIVWSQASAGCTVQLTDLDINDQETVFELITNRGGAIVLTCTRVKFDNSTLLYGSVFNGSGATGGLTATLADCQVSTNSAFTQAAAAVVSLAIERSMLVTNMTFSQSGFLWNATYLLESFIVRQSFIRSTGDLGAYHLISLNDANLSVVTIDDSILMADRSKASILLFNKTGATMATVAIRRNLIAFDGNASIYDAVALGVTGTAATRAAILAGLDANKQAQFTSVVVTDNTIINPNADGRALYLGVALKNVTCARNELVGGNRGHTFQVASNGAVVHHNVSRGLLPGMVWGDGVKFHSNTLISCGGSTILIGAPSGTSWEATSGGSIRFNLAINLGGGYCFSDYSNGALGVRDVTTEVNNNIYIRLDGGPVVLLRNTDCYTVAQAKVQWGLMTPAIANDTASQVWKKAPGPLWAPSSMTPAGAKPIPGAMAPILP